MILLIKLMKIEIFMKMKIFKNLKKMKKFKVFITKMKMRKKIMKMDII